MSRHSTHGLLGLFLVFVLVLACTESNDGTTLVAPRSAGLAKSTVKDPTATFQFPLNDAGLSVKSDGQVAPDDYSAYEEGVCGVHAKIFATAELSNSGDATMQTDNPRYRDRKCPIYPRTLTLVYSATETETTPVFMNVRQIHNTSFQIALGETIERTFAIQTPHCEQLLWSTTRQGVPIEADNVLVTRVSTNTWRVQSQPAPNNRAFCLTNGATYNMDVDFTIVASGL